MTTTTTTTTTTFISVDDILCKVCDRHDREDIMLLCDGCNRGFHTDCIGLKKVPSEAYWYCKKCVLDSSGSSDSSITNASIYGYNIKEVYVYIRVSSKGQDKPEYGRVGMLTQNNAILDYCSKNNLFIKNTYKEVGSAYNGKMPVLLKLIEDMEPGIPIIVYSFSRFSRNMNYCLDLVAELKKKKSYIISVSEGITSKHDNFFDFISVSEKESVNQSTRMKDVFSRLRNQNSYIGKKPFGYDIVKINGINHLKENAIELKIAEGIKKLYASGRRMSSILDIVKDKYHRYKWSIGILNSIITKTEKDYEKYLIDKTQVSGINSGLMTTMLPIYDAIDEIDINNTIDEVDIEEEEEEENEEYVNNTVIKTIDKILKIDRCRDGLNFNILWSDGSKTYETISSIYKKYPNIVKLYLQLRFSTNALKTKKQLGL